MEDYDVDYADENQEQNQNPLDIIQHLQNGYKYIVYWSAYSWDFFVGYAWQLVFASIIFYYIYKNLVKPRLENAFGSYDDYRRRKEDAEYAAKYHKNPDLFAARISAQQEAAQKLQEKYNREAEEYQRKLKEKEEQKRQELLEKMEGTDGHRLGSDSREKKSKSFKPEYNPLMGAGSSSNYRPPKKSKCGGGGCGK